ncbi:MAG TPA: hypothetical protein PKN36_03810 [bacterium]|nr:hypothetical protein [bacterium]
MDDKLSLSIKPHHLVDIIISFGYESIEFKPHPFGHAVHKVAETVFNNPDEKFCIELGADTICSPCKYNVNNRCIDTIDTSYRPLAPRSKNEWNLLLDRRWCEKLGLKQGDVLTARQFGRLVEEKGGDISDIYRELPSEMISKRKQALAKGLKNFLSK